MTDEEDYQHDYTDIQVETFVDLDKKGQRILNKWKNYSIALFVLLLFLMQLYIEYNLGWIEKLVKSFFELVGFNIIDVHKLHINKSIYIGMIIFSVIILYPLLVRFSKYVLHKKIRKTDKKFIFENQSVLKQFLSPDSYYSEYYKGKLKSDFNEDILTLINRNVYYTKENEESGISVESWNQIRIERKFFIEWSNWLNCIITIGICVITLIVIYFSCNVYSVIFMFSLLVYRLFSRGIEIALSFYKDVVNKKAKIFYKNSDVCKYLLDFKSSLLRSRGRLSLAIHSLIELIFLYSNLYFINSFFTNALSENVLTPFNSLLFSASLGVFNISFDYKDPYLHFPQSIFHVSQILLSVVLILLSIAQYVGTNDDLSKSDEKLYLEVEIRKRK